MHAFHTYLHWIDDGERRQLLGWESRHATIGIEDVSSCDGRWQDDECRCDHPHAWRGMAPREEIISQSGDGYPTRYELSVEGVVAVYSRAREFRLCVLSLGREPIDAGSRIAELRELPADTVLIAEEWDQS